MIRCDLRLSYNKRLELHCQPFKWPLATNKRRRHDTRNRLDEALIEAQAGISGSEPHPDSYHTLGTVYRRLRRYDEAADAFEKYIEHLAPFRQEEKSEWTRAEISFLRSFEGRTPMNIVGSEVDTAVHTIPFSLVKDKVVVRGRVNGGELIDLVIDTGAEQMVISQEMAQNMGVRSIVNTISAGVGDVGLRGLDLGRVDSLQIESLEVHNVPTIIKNPPLTNLPTRRVRDSISPLALGLSAVIDYKNEQLVLSRHLPDEPADIELSMRVHRLAVVRGLVNNEHKKSFVIDTGGEVISISLATAGILNMRPVRHIPLRVYGTSGWDVDAYLLPGVNLAFNEIKYDKFSVVVLNLHRPSALLGFHIGGIIGHEFLSNYRVSIDMDRAALRLVKS